MQIDLGTFIEDCRIGLAADGCARTVREVVARLVRDHGALAEALGKPIREGIHTLHRSSELTILNVVWPPNMRIMPHDHRMWAVIGVYGGREDNDFWRRVPEATNGRIERIDARTLARGDAVVLDVDVIHSVTNPTSGLTGAIHVYGGDFFAAARSAWDPQSLAEQPFDGESAKRLFEATR